MDVKYKNNTIDGKVIDFINSVFPNEFNNNEI